jgi:hypothetical protein
MKKTRTRKPRATKTAANEAYVRGRIPGSTAGKKNLITGTAIPPERIEYFNRTRFEPIRNLSPESLTRQLVDLSAGYYREVMQTFEAIQNRDDVLKGVIGKRSAAITRLPWEICVEGSAQDDPAAEKHKAALEYFYRNIEATNALDNNQRGGLSLLLKQMMDAVAKKYAVHQIIWKPENGNYTATFNFMPLHFFENTVGRLRFIAHEGALYGEDPQFEMMTTVGAGLMEPCAVAYMFKKMTFSDWMVYMERHGQPAFVYKTQATPETEAWEAAEEFVGAIASSFAGVIAKDDEVQVTDLKASGQIPYPQLVERMDRTMAALWRGADLSTISAGTGQGQGASLQATEEVHIQADDAQLLSETLNIHIDRKVIEMMFGVGVRPLAYFKLKVPKAINVDQEIKIDKHLREFQIPLAIPDVLERFDRAPAKDDAELVPEPEPEPETIRFGANEREMKGYIKNATTELAKRNLPALAPVLARLDGALQLDDLQFIAALRNFSRDKGKIIRELNRHPGAREAIEETVIGAILNGRAKTVVDTTRKSS